MKEILKYFKFIKDVEAVIRSKSQKFLTVKYMEQNHAELCRLMERFMGIFYPEIKIAGCQNRFFDNFYLLRSLNKSKIIEVMNVKHKLKKNDNLYVIGGESYSHKSKHITNEVCQAIYNKYGEKVFDYFDKDWNKNVLTLADLEKAEVKQLLSNSFEGMEVLTETVKTEDVKTEIVPDELSENDKSENDKSEETVYEEFTAEVVDYSAMKMKELQAIAKEKGINSFGMKKADLIKELSK